MNIKTPTARAALKVRIEPYWYQMAKGQHVGYRKTPQGQGTWIARYRGDDKVRRFQALGAINDDDHRSAFDKARALAEKWFKQQHQTSADAEIVTLEQLCLSYVEDRRAVVGEKNAHEAELIFKRLVYDTPFGRTPLFKLQSTQVLAWRNALITSEKSLALKGLNPTQIEAKRRANKNTANRIYSYLQAALNYGREHSAVATDDAWRPVRMLPNAKGKRELLLNKQQRQHLLDASPADLRLLCEALLLTCARVGEMVKIIAKDFNPSADRKLRTRKLELVG